MQDETSAAREAIVKVGGEGGSLTLFRFRRGDGSWRFVVATDESTMASLLDEDDLEGLELKTEGAICDSLDQGLTDFDRYPWAHLVPLHVHPEYRDRIRAEVAARLALRPGRYEERWERLLQGDEP